MIIQTRNTRYILQDLGDGAFTISGDVMRCPTPTPCELLWPIEEGRPMGYRPTAGPWREAHNATAFVMTSPVVGIDA